MAPLPHRAVRPAPYQGGASFNVFSAQGSNPLGDCKISGKGIQKVYDKTVKTYVYSLYGGPTSRIQLPKDENKTGLQLLQPFVVFQIFVPKGQPLLLELRISDTTNTRRKMYFSTSFNDVKSTPLHCQIPITVVKRDIWLSFSIHVEGLFLHCFKGSVFRSVDAIVLGPICKLRKIFTMRNRLVDVERDCNSSSSCAEDYLPQEHMFAVGVENAFQVLDTTSLPSTTKNSLDHLNGTTEDLMKIQKNKSNKQEPRQVHVAFGSRMPLPLSTVQINANILGDHKLRTNRFLQKEQERSERDGPNFPFETEMPSNSCEKKLMLDAKVDKHKTKTLQNLLKQANTFNRSNGMLKFQKDHSSMSNEKKNPTIDEHIDMPSNLAISTSLKASNQITKFFESHSINNDVAHTSINLEEASSVTQEDGHTMNNLQKTNEGVHSKQTPHIEALNLAALDAKMLDTNTNKAFEEEILSHGKKEQEELKFHYPRMSSKKSFRQSSFVESERKKEYKYSKYMDSPPESPPCGWTSTVEDKTAKKSFELPLFFNKSFESGNDLEAQDHLFQAESQSLEDNHATKSWHESARESKMANKLACSSTGTPNGLNILSSQHSADEPALLTMGNGHGFVSNALQPTRAVNETFELGANAHHLVFHDSEFATTMSDEVHSFGVPSWSSSDSQHEQGDVVTNQMVGMKPDGTIFSMMNEDSQENLESISQELKTLENEVKQNDMDGYNSTHLGSISCPTMDQSPRFQKRLRALTLDVEKNLDEMLTPSSSNSMDSTNECMKLTFPVHEERELVVEVDEEETPNYMQQANDGLQTTTNNGRFDEDLDLLYDFTLDCYYDPKTNRYYELK